MSGDPINTILLRGTTPRQSVRPGAITDDPINTILAMLRSQRERQRQEAGSSKMVTPEELDEKRLERLLEDPSATAREIEDFRDELGAALFGSGRRIIPDDVTAALDAKIEAT